MSITLAVAKQHMRVETPDEDVIIGAYLAAAKSWVEGYTEKKLERGLVEVELSSLAGTIELTVGPQPADAVVQYIDVNGDAQTITNANIAGNRLSYPQGWPAIEQGSTVTLTYSAGYEATPTDLDLAVLLLAGEYYINREVSNASPAATASVEELCRPYRKVLV